jgi:hypothetical protein
VPTVRLGNKQCLDRDSSGAVLEGNRVTTFTILDEDDLDTRMRTLVHDDGIWPRHSSAPAAWVDGDDEELVAALAEHFDCPVGEPDDWS